MCGSPADHVVIAVGIEGDHGAEVDRLDDPTPRRLGDRHDRAGQHQRRFQPRRAGLWSSSKPNQ